MPSAGRHAPGHAYEDVSRAPVNRSIKGKLGTLSRRVLATPLASDRTIRERPGNPPGGLLRPLASSPPSRYPVRTVLYRGPFPSRVCLMTRRAWFLAIVLPPLALMTLVARTVADEPNAAGAKAVWPGMTSAGTVLLPNGWSLKPAGPAVAARRLPGADGRAPHASRSWPCCTPATASTRS